MNCLSKPVIFLLIYFSLGASFADNQTAQLSPVFPASGLPFRVEIEKTTIQLPIGNHSGVIGVYKGQWVVLAGRTDGMHGFGNDPFAAASQNRNVYVINPTTGTVLTRSLTDPSSGLNQQQIDSLSVTSPQFYQESDTLYMTGGYGIDTNAGTFSTKPVLTTLYLPGIVQWVNQIPNQSVIQNIRQIYNPLFQVTGGEMFKLGSLTQLVFGQNFTGIYTGGSNGDYSEQVRRFQLSEINGQLSVIPYPAKPLNPDPNFRRRDLNIVPTLINNNNTLQYGLVAYAGVFTPSDGAWTVPVVLSETSDPMMADPNLPSTFKQAMNQYVCATASLYSRQSMNMYHLFFGGISYGFFANGVFQTDDELPFINQITTVKMDKNGHFSQYLMDSEYPVILSTDANPGNPLLFGAGAYFVANNILQYPNGVISLDTIRKPTVIGYIVGGIQSTLPNTNTESDSTASAYVFKVTLIPKQAARIDK